MEMADRIPYGYLYVTDALLLLVWLVLAVLTVTIRLYRRDKESKRLFRHERMFFRIYTERKILYIW